MENTTEKAEEKTGENLAILYRYYRQPVKTLNELKQIMGHMLGFMEIADNNNRDVIIEIWFRQR
jgi:hypothetical protein